VVVASVVVASVVVASVVVAAVVVGSLVGYAGYLLSFVVELVAEVVVDPLDGALVVPPELRTAA